MDANTHKFKSRRNNKTNWLSALFFCSTLSVLRKGYHRPINQDDLYTVLSEHESCKIGNKLQIQWEKELKKAKPSLWRALFKLYLTDFTLLGIVYIINEFLKLAQVVALGNLVAYYTPNQSTITKNRAYFCAASIGAISLLNALILQNYFMAMQHLGMKLRIACTSLIYRKLLRLSQNALLDTTTGQLANLISNDVSRFDVGVVHLHGMMAAPIVVAAAMYLTYWSVGGLATVGLSVFVCFVPLQIYAAKRISEYRLSTASKTDERVRLMNEILKGIKVIKMYRWEKLFSELVANARKAEITQISGAAYLKSLMVSLQSFTTRFAIFIVILTYVLYSNTPTAYYVFFVTSFYNTLKVIMTIHLPTGMYEGAEVHVSVKRIQKILLYDERDDLEETTCIKCLRRQNLIKTNSDSIQINQGTAKWYQTSTENTLKDINLTIKKSQTLAVVGPVGSGKSSLLHLILKELALTEGSCEVSGSISYCPQEPFLFRETIKQNILFGQPYNESRYEEVLKISQLKHDLKFLPSADKTHVGDRGMLLSGGQKARINLARALYKQADIYLLDDPLSAVDSNVGRKIFENCVLGYLKSKTVVLVTHQVQYLKSIEDIVVLDKGMIVAKGSFEELESVLNFDKYLQSERDERKEIEQVARNEVEESKLEEVADLEEMKRSGGVSRFVYGWYITAGGGICLSITILLLFLLSQTLASGADYFITFWVNMEETILDTKLSKNLSETLTNFFTPEMCVYFYSGLIVGLVVETVMCSFFFMRFCLKASTKIHVEIFSKIVNATMNCFNNTSTGSILNRLSEDIGAIDEVLPITILDTIQIGLAFIGGAIITAIVSYWLLVPTIIMTLVCLPLRKFYLATSRNVKRLEAATRSPIFAHINATLQGLTTIRAFNIEEILKEEFHNYQNTHSSAYYLFLKCTRMFSAWIDIILSFFVAIISFSFLLFDSEQFAGNVGLAITQALSMSSMVQWGLREWTEFENQMTSVERIWEYTEITSEHNDEQKRAPENWPKEGKVEFRCVCLRYSPGQKFAIKNVTFTIQPKEKIGVVGRTGAGKSSLVSALFQLQKTEGTILIDDISINNIDLSDLRSNISIIPQEPILFSATLRKNLDPFGLYSDENLWNALEDVELKPKILQLPGCLDFKVQEDGANFSIGQRQLLCLARAILRNNKILVLDEATANVDHVTDLLIQKTIRAKFADCTVITVAHRLNTVLDSDRVMVMDGGELVEFGDPKVLVKVKGSLFGKMMRQASVRT